MPTSFSSLTCAQSTLHLGHPPALLQTFILQVFVAGGTGRLGARIVRELLMKGLNVRAGVRNVQKAQNFVNLASQYGILPSNAGRRIKLVEYDLSDEGSVANAIGNAGRVSPMSTPLPS